MHICLVSKEFPPETGYGGIGTYTLHFARLLSRAGIQVTIISMTQKYAKETKIKYSNKPDYMPYVSELVAYPIYKAKDIELMINWEKEIDYFYSRQKWESRVKNFLKKWTTGPEASTKIVGTIQKIIN